MYDSLQPCGLQPTRLLIHGILQARVLQWVAIPFSKASVHLDKSYLKNCSPMWMCHCPLPQAAWKFLLFQALISTWFCQYLNEPCMIAGACKHYIKCYYEADPVMYDSVHSFMICHLSGKRKHIHISLQIVLVPQRKQTRCTDGGQEREGNLLRWG